MTDKPNSTELINMAHREWKNRQKRKGHDDAVPWTSGWISGYLTGKGSLSSELLQELERIKESYNTPFFPSEMSKLNYVEYGRYLAYTHVISLIRDGVKP